MAAPRSWDLVIFDCDGVLVDTEPVSNAVLAAMMGEIGLSLSVEEVTHRFTGYSNAECMRIIDELLGHPAPPTFLREFDRRELDALSSGLRPIPGVVDALDQITLATCVASSGTPEKMRLTLGATGLLPRFEGRIFSATEVARGKPAPDLYLYAADQMGVAPTRCAVVEDSPIGA